jgi:hypothetical protein
VFYKSSLFNQLLVVIGFFSLHEGDTYALCSKGFAIKLIFEDYFFFSIT